MSKDGVITITVEPEEKEFLQKLLYRKYLSCPDTGTMQKCGILLNKLGYVYPGFDYLFEEVKGLDT